MRKYKEDFLHLVWKLRIWNNTNLKTIDGQTVQILKPGTHNTNAGPDFLNASVIINGIQWIGHIEIHVNGKDWYSHRHHLDPAYNNVVLHVVARSNGKVHNQQGSEIPEINLTGRIPPYVLRNYDRLITNENLIPCWNWLPEIDRQLLNLYLEKLSIERLQHKSEKILTEIDLNRCDWNQLLFIQIAKYLGQPANGSSMCELLQSVPLKIIYKHNDLVSTEAILFGCAGMLNQSNISEDSYLEELKARYKYLRRLHPSIKPQSIEWKWSRMRPANFPSVRISQIAGLLHKHSNLFGTIRDAHSAKEIEDILDTSVSVYWRRHADFGKLRKSHSGSLGSSTKKVLLINAIVPTLFTYHKSQGNIEQQVQVAEWLSEIACENNHIIRRWRTAGLHCTNASESQALIELRQSYCDRKRCLDCSIGASILKKND